ncbi:chemosensory receptor a [Plakobranchus ocellatus]|uniref:Chemosensory receptor a n=1 Tax=Plakobranchus ocellatus TaxID=259542 RepID=A0AAV4AG80_9GAST|nr:chemosensory receptor a [Plakobranchus ocellatus]
MSIAANTMEQRVITSTVGVDLHPGHDPDLQPVTSKVKDIWVLDNNFKEVFTTVSLGFLGLAVADLGCLLTQLWLNIMYIPEFRNLGAWLLPFDPADPTFRNVTAAWPHICFARITGLITAYATLVRCLCIAMPLQVKTLLTPGRSLVVIISIFLAMFAIISPVFFTSPLGWKFSTKRNRTSAARSSDDARDSKQNQTTKPGTGTVSKETKVIKLVVIISTIFIVSYFPSTAVFLVATAMPGFSATGKYHNLFFVACSLTYNMEAINSSVNILIYLNMSSKYRATFDAMFCKGDATPMVGTKE